MSNKSVTEILYTENVELKNTISKLECKLNLLNEKLTLLNKIKKLKITEVNLLNQINEFNTEPAPVTPAPSHVTPEPVTPEPVTPEPVTPEPVTPEPVTPEPVTPEHPSVLTYHDVDWSITQPLYTALMYDVNTDSYYKVSDAVWNTDLGVTQDDKVTLLYSGKFPSFAVPVKGTTFKDMLTTISEGMNIKFTQQQEYVVEQHIKTLNYSVSDTQGLYTKFNNGELTVADLLGPKRVYLGGLKRKNGLWTYNMK